MKDKIDSAIENSKKKEKKDGEVFFTFWCMFSPFPYVHPVYLDFS